MTKWRINEDRTRRVGTLCDGDGRGEPDGGESVFFEQACDQTDRLVAHRSNRHEQNNVWLLSLAALQQQLTGFGQHAPLGVDASHESVRLGCESAN